MSGIRSVCWGLLPTLSFHAEASSIPKPHPVFSGGTGQLTSISRLLLQSDSRTSEQSAREMALDFCGSSPRCCFRSCRQFMIGSLSFGDFVFRMPDGRAVGTADNLRSFEEQLAEVAGGITPISRERNHFSNWLKARTEFWLAHQLRPRKVSDYPTVEELAARLDLCCREFRREQRVGTVADFDAATFDPENSFARIGTGSLGGKARGLAFVSTLLKNFRLHEQFPQTRIAVPPAVIIATDVFDQFLDTNQLRDMAIHATDDDALTNSFLSAELPDQVTADLLSYLALVNYPIAVRSSSLLEDSRHQPFAGIYQTFMLPNNHENIETRLKELESAIKRVYASIFMGFERKTTSLRPSSP